MDALRSFLRKREQWERRNPQADSHVRFYLRQFTETERKKFTCPNCKSEIRNLDRPRDLSGRMKKHCGCSTNKTIGMTPEQLAEHRRQKVISLKAKYRREKGARLRSEMKAAAQQKRNAKQLAKSDAHVQLRALLIASLHDAHVDKYQKVLMSRAIYRKRWEKDPQRERNRVSKYKSRLPDAYVISNIKVMGVPGDAITPELIELKREAMQFRRLSSQAKTILINHRKETHESLTKHA